MCTSLLDLPQEYIQILLDFQFWYDPKYIKLCGSFADGSWVFDLDSEMAKARESLGKRVRISDLDIHTNLDVKYYRGIDFVADSVGVYVFENGIWR